MPRVSDDELKARFWAAVDRLEALWDIRLGRGGSARAPL